MSNLANGIQRVISWMSSWRLSPNLSKTKIMLFPSQPDVPPLLHPTFPQPIDIVSSHKHLGIFIDSNLSWDPHIDYICKRSSSSLGILSSHCYHLPISCKLLFYSAYIRPIFDYADTAWAGISTTRAEKLEIQHKKVLKILLRKPRMLPSSTLYALAHTTPLSKRRNSHLVTLIHSLKLNLCPPHLHCFNWFSSRSTRNSLSLPKPKSSFLLHSPLFTAYSAWLALPQEAKDLSSLRLFKSLVAP